MHGIEISATLTDTWKEYGVKKSKEYEILTAELSKATFGMTPSEYKKHKSLKRENLRDHMNDLELMFSIYHQNKRVASSRLIVPFNVLASSTAGTFGSLQLPVSGCFLLLASHQDHSVSGYKLLTVA